MLKVSNKRRRMTQKKKTLSPVCIVVSSFSHRRETGMCVWVCRVDSLHRLINGTVISFFHSQVFSYDFWCDSKNHFLQKNRFSNKSSRSSNRAFILCRTQNVSLNCRRCRRHSFLFLLCLWETRSVDII